MSRHRDRRPDFKGAVYRGDLPAGVKVVLLRLLDDMNHKLIVSVPRSRLAEDLSVDPSRISEATAKARRLGYLDIVRRGRPGITAVYQGLLVGAESAPQAESQHGAENSTCLSADSAPQNGGHMVRIPCTQVGNGPQERSDRLDSTQPNSYAEGVAFHPQPTTQIFKSESESHTSRSARSVEQPQPPTRPQEST